MRTQRSVRRLGLLLAACAILGSPGSAALGVIGRVRAVPFMGTPGIGVVGAAPWLAPLSRSSAGTLLLGPGALAAPVNPAAALPLAASPIAARMALPRASVASAVRTQANIAPAASAQVSAFESAKAGEESNGAAPLPTVALAAAAVSHGSRVFDGGPTRGHVSPVFPRAFPQAATALSRASEGMLASIRRTVPPPRSAGAAAASGWLAVGAALAAQFPLLEVLTAGMGVGAAMPLVTFLFERHVPIVAYIARALGRVVTLPFRLGFPPEAVRRSAWTLVLSLPILAVAWIAWSYPPFQGIRLGLAAAALGPLPVYLSVRLATGIVRALGRGWSDLTVSAFGLSAVLLILGSGILSGAKVLAAAAPLMSMLGAALQPELGMGLVLGALVPPLTLLLWSGLSHFLGILPHWVSSPLYFLGNWLKETVPPHAAADIRILIPLVLFPAAAAGVLYLVSPSSALVPGLLAAALLAAVQFLLHNTLAGFAQAVFWATGTRASRGGRVIHPWRMAAAIAGLAVLSVGLLWFAALAMPLPPAATGLGVMLLVAFPTALWLMRRAISPLETGRSDGKVV